MYKPKVSIVIPAYNASNYLTAAIDSALAQTYSNLEIIVVNDGSRDNGATERIALSYGERIRYIYKENGGSSSALNTGISAMTGEWFSWLSHDDLYRPEKLEKQIAYMQTLCLDCGQLSRHVFFTAYDLIDSDGKIISSPNLRQEHHFAEKVNSFPHNGHLIAEPTVYNFHGCSALVHRNAFEDVGGFNESLRMINDLDQWYRLFAAGYRIHYLPEVLVSGRIHGAQVSKTIGYSYHNLEQDMFWSRSLDWLLKHYSDEKELLFLFARNAYLKTRDDDGDRAFAYLQLSRFQKIFLKAVYQGAARIRNAAKSIYLKQKT